MKESFLLCFHEGHTDVFQSGKPLGVIRDGTFHVHENKMPDGTKVPVQIAAAFVVQVSDAVQSLTQPKELAA
jgi:hypothetical protein